MCRFQGAANEGDKRATTGSYSPQKFLEENPASNLVKCDQKSEGFVMPKRGRPRKLGAFEACSFFKALMQHASFVDVELLVTDRGLIVEELSAPTICRLLGQTGIRLNRNTLPDSGGPERSVAIRANKWEQPVETRCQGTSPVSGILWRILTGKGLMAFMLTADDSAETVVRVARAAAGRLGSRKRRVVTNHAGLEGALRADLKGWRIDAG